MVNPGGRTSTSRSESESKVQFTNAGNPAVSFSSPKNHRIVEHRASGKVAISAEDRFQTTPEE
jgi:hypothetical protein